MYTVCVCLDGLPDFPKIKVHECWTDSKASQWIHFYIVMPSWNKLIMMKVTADNIQRNKREDNVFFKHTCTEMLHEHC